MALTIEGPEPGPQPAGEATDIVLQGAAGDRYIAQLQAAIHAARLNALFPPELRLREQLGFLGPRGSEGLYPRLRLSARSGLPSALTVCRVKVDRDQAREFLAQLGSPQDYPPGGRASRRVAYYRRLADAALMPLNRMRLELRRQVPDEYLAQFRVVLDRFDLTSCHHARYTVLLTQRHRVWRRQQLAVDGADLVAPTESFRRVLGQLTFHGAQRAFELLDAAEQIEVEDVRRCSVGPMILPGMPAGPALAEVLQQGGESSWLLCCVEDRASRQLPPGVQPDGLAAQLAPAAGPEHDGQRQAQDIGLARVYKLVCPRPLQQPLRQLCQQLGQPSVVRGIPAEARQP